MELINRIALTDYQVAYEMHEIDPIRLFRYYKSIGVFTTSKKSPKYRDRCSKTHFLQALDVVRDVDKRGQTRIIYDENNEIVRKID